MKYRDGFIREGTVMYTSRIGMLSCRIVILHQPEGSRRKLEMRVSRLIVLLTAGLPNEQKVYFDITIGGAPAGRITMQLESET